MRARRASSEIGTPKHWAVGNPCGAKCPLLAVGMFYQLILRLDESRR